MNARVLEEVNARQPFDCERRLALHDHVCEGRITREHALIYAGSRIDEPWAIVLLCAKSHSVDEWQDCGILDKRKNEWIAINRMSATDMRRLSKVNWSQKKAYLNSLFGKLKLSTN